MCQTVLCQDCSTLVQRLPHKSEQLPWPARSPDLAPIEHVLDIVSRNARSHNNVRTNHQMIAKLRRHLGAIAQNDKRTIIGSMLRWCTACVRADGGHNAY